MEIQKKNWLKYSLGFIACLLVRFIPFRAPNIEPILATQMPFSRAYGGIAGFAFAFFSIIVFDMLTSGLGMWTFVTAVAYGLLSFAAVAYFKNKKGTVMDYAKFAIVGTLAYDAVTGLTVGPILFHQTFYSALIGQIPFTILHLIGNVSFALLLSPLIYHLVTQKKKFEISSIIKIFNPKQI